MLTGPRLVVERLQTSDLCPRREGAIEKGPGFPGEGTILCKIHRAHPSSSSLCTCLQTGTETRRRRLQPPANSVAIQNAASKYVACTGDTTVRIVQQENPPAGLRRSSQVRLPNMHLQLVWNAFFFPGKLLLTTVAKISQFLVHS